MINKRHLIAINLIFVFFLAKISFAQNSPSLIRDAETEKFLHELADPIFSAAGLEPKNIKIYIVNDDGINAFVSGGQNVFINTGLILKYKTPDALIGVIAHETGHIAAGHLARSKEGEEQAQGALLLSYLLGIGAIAAGSPDAGMALISGGSDTAQRLFMKFTRNQEEAADQHAIEYLDKLQYPASGLVNLLEFFEQEMIGYKDKIDEYLLSHPVSRKRIDLIKERTKDKNFSDKRINQKLQRRMDIVTAKLEAFIENPDVTISKYQNRNDQLSNYKKAIAFFRRNQTKESLDLLSKIINEEKGDKTTSGFLFELNGQILFESGLVEESILSYDQAIKLLAPNDAAQAKIAFASGILSLKKDDKELLSLAVKKLEEAKLFENESPFLFRQLASAYDRLGNSSKSLLSLAEFNLLIDQKEKCRKYATQAKEELKKLINNNDPDSVKIKSEILHADDLIELAKEKEGEEKKQKLK